MEEIKYTNKDIVDAMSKMSNESVERLSLLEMKNIYDFVNGDDEHREQVLLYFKYWKAAFDALVFDLTEIYNVITSQTEPSTKEIMDKMTATYKDFSYEEKVEFNALLNEQNTLVDSICILRNTLKRLTGYCKNKK